MDSATSLRIEFRAMHFLNIDVHFSTLGALLHVLLELVDLAPLRR